MSKKEKYFSIIESGNDPYSTIDSLIKFINENTDFTVYDNPLFDGSSDIGLIITKEELEDDELLDIAEKMADDEIEYTQVTAEDEEDDENYED